MTPEQRYKKIRKCEKRGRHTWKRVNRRVEVCRDCESRRDEW